VTAGKTEPGTLAQNKLGRTLSPFSMDDIRYVPTIEENLDRTETVTLDQVKKLYESQVGGGHAELAVVGDFDPEGTVKAVKAILAGWESKVPVKRVEGKVVLTVPGSQSDIVTPDKANAEYLAGLSIAMTDADPDFAALRIGNFIFGGSTLSSRIGDRIRQ